MNTKESVFVRDDALRVLALPVSRWRDGERHPTWDTHEDVYSNGTEADLAIENAIAILDVGPALRKVLEAGISALRSDPEMDSYIGALYAGDHDKLIEVERAFTARAAADLTIENLAAQGVEGF